MCLVFYHYTKIPDTAAKKETYISAHEFSGFGPQPTGSIAMTVVRQTIIVAGVCDSKE